MKKPMPTSIESYTEIKDLDYYFVDKTKIFEIFDTIKSVFFIRPRRFGKSLTLSMLCTFYDVNYAKDFDKYFKGMYIYDKIKLLRYKPNKFEVIRLSFKNIQWFDSLEWYRAKIREIILRNYFDIGIISKELIDNYNSWLLQLWDLLRNIINTSKQYILLIDEYDSPVNHAIWIWDYDLAEKILEDLKSFYLDLKWNPNVAKTIITGINKLAKSWLFSWANQFVDITFDKRFSNKLWFLEEELDTLINYTWIKNVSIEKLRSFYNWYYFCKKNSCKSVYNPYSMLNFIDSWWEFELYWAWSGTYKYLSDLIDKMMIKKNEEYKKLKEDIEGLLNWEKISFEDTEIWLNFNIKSITKTDIFRLMLYTWFLTLSESWLVIANKETLHEIVWIYSYMLQNEKSVNIDLLQTLKEFVLDLKIEKFRNIEYFINNCVLAILKFRFSYYLKEQAYTLILASVLWFQSHYEVIWEQETWDWYADLVLTPTENWYPGYVFEFKRLIDKQKITKSISAKKCIEQIKEKKYVNEMRKKNKNIKIYGVGVVMKGKKVVDMVIEQL